MKIRDWLRKAEDARRTYVELPGEKSEAELERERRRANDARHGLLLMAGRAGRRA